MKKWASYYKYERFFFLFKTTLFFICINSFPGYSQNCPLNIDFETGTFSGWTCYIGSTAAVNGQNVISLYESGPVPGRHTMFTAGPTTILDPYGNFPVNCPNGSGHSIRVGNDLPGTEAEGISYEFTIPADQNVYSLIYHYAVVFEDPSHEPFQQPRMEIEITNVTDNKIIDCSSFTFIPNGSSLPGFFESPVLLSNAPIWCKDWTAVSINLNGNAGKKIRLFFKTADCTFRRHFGYAYIDVNSECSSEFVGASYCPDDTAVNVTAPHGYQAYTWYNNNFTQVLGDQQTIRISPPPPVGTRLAVEMVPYFGYGCLDTLYALLIDTLTTVANAGIDTISCNQNPVQIGANPKPGFIYSWNPSTGLNNPGIANPFASPGVTITYTLTVRHDGGGCLTTDEVIVKPSFIDSTILLNGKAIFCEGFGDSCMLTVQPTAGIQWYRDNNIIAGATQPQYLVTRSGTYAAMLINNDGCTLETQKKEVLIDKAKPSVEYPLKYAVINIPLQLEARQFGSDILWSPAVNLDNPTSPTPFFTSNEDQLYTIRITTNTGCVTVDRQWVKVIPSVEIYVPTAFTPNNDGRNDFLRPSLRGIKELYYFRIYNRWGQLVYNSRNEEQGWDGKINGLIQSSQVVVWIAEGIGVDNKLYQRKGTCVLMR